MYKPPGARQAVDQEGNGKHDLTIEPNGQVIFSSAFHGRPNLISSTIDTYFEVHWLEEKQEIIISFAEASQIKEQDENFEPANTDEEVKALRKQGIFKLKGSELKIGLMKVLRDGCTKTIIPNAGHRTKFREDEDLFIGEDKETGSKYITLNTAGKTPEQSKSDKEAKRKQVKIIKWCKLFMEKPEEFRKTIFKDKDWNKEWQDEFWSMINKVHGSGSIYVPGATSGDIVGSHGALVRYDREASTEAERQEQRAKLASQ